MNISRNHFEHRGFSLSYLDSAPGDTERPAVLLLHGFPDESEMWRPQIEALHAAGYRCIAPDTLGCGQSDMAPRVRDYNAKHIASDHAALLDHLQIEKAHVAGHDWGAVIAWMLGAHFPQRVNRLVVMSVGHPTVYGRAGLSQKLLGWYVLFFQLGGFSEKLLSGKGRFSLPNVFVGHPKMDEVVKRLQEPGRLTGALRLYRAALYTILIQAQPKVSAPTLGLWSDGDAFLVEEQMTDSEPWVEGPWRYERLSGGHWMTLEQPQRINELLLDFLSEK